MTSGESLVVPKDINFDTLANEFGNRDDFDYEFGLMVENAAFLVSNIISKENVMHRIFIDDVKREFWEIPRMLACSDQNNDGSGRKVEGNMYRRISDTKVAIISLEGSLVVIDKESDYQITLMKKNKDNLFSRLYTITLPNCFSQKKIIIEKWGFGRSGINIPLPGKHVEYFWK